MLELMDKVVDLWKTDPQLSGWASTTFKNVGPFNLSDIKNKSFIQFGIMMNDYRKLEFTDGKPIKLDDGEEYIFIGLINKIS